MNSSARIVIMGDADIYIRIMAEQGGASPVWNEYGSNMEIEDFALTPEIAERLRKWNALYAAQDFGREDHGFDLEAFAKEGKHIARHIKAANPDWFVVYFDEFSFDQGRKAQVEIE